MLNHAKLLPLKPLLNISYWNMKNMFPLNGNIHYIKYKMVPLK